MMCSENGFPKILLSRSKAERQKHFADFTIEHPVLENAFKDLRRIARLPAGKSLVFIIGPTRVGKTFLKEWIEDEIRFEWAKKQASDPGRIPVVGMLIPQDCSWKQYYEEMLIALAEPCIDKKIIFADVAISCSEYSKPRIQTQASRFKLRYALEAALIYRRPFLVSNDEAQHFLYMDNLPILEGVDRIKSLSDRGQVLQALYGTYEMMDMLDLSDQLMGRSHIIHFHNYSNTNKDLGIFANILNTFAKQMPFRQEPKLIAHLEYLYERSAGCVGLLRNWLVQAYNEALEKNCQTLTLNHLQNCVPLSATRSLRMLRSFEQSKKDLAELIGKDDDSRPIEPQEDSEDEIATKTKSGRSNRKRTSVGKRKAGPRDRIGRR